jgi:hypothetical protein
MRRPSSASPRRKCSPRAPGRKVVYFRARTGNTQDIILGSPTVTVNGAIRLAAGTQITIDTAAAAEWWAIAGGAGQNLDILTARSRALAWWRGRDAGELEAELEDLAGMSPRRAGARAHARSSRTCRPASRRSRRARAPPARTATA